MSTGYNDRIFFFFQTGNIRISVGREFHDKESNSEKYYYFYYCRAVLYRIRYIEGNTILYHFLTVTKIFTERRWLRDCHGVMRRVASGSLLHRPHFSITPPDPLDLHPTRTTSQTAGRCPLECPLTPGVGKRRDNGNL